jgi:hypothetical protein
MDGVWDVRTHLEASRALKKTEKMGREQERWVLNLKILFHI